MKKVRLLFSEGSVLSSVRQRWAWAGAVVAVLLLIASTGYAQCWGDQAKAQGYGNAALLASGQEVADHLGEAGVRILDARSPERYAAGHIPGAVNLPVAEVSRTINGVPGMLTPVREVEQALGARGVTRESRVVIYDDFGGDQATRLFWALDFMGHPRVSVLQGGFGLWQREGRPVARDPSQPLVTRYRAAPDSTRLADAAWVKARLDDPAAVLVDSRSPEEFDGEVPGREVSRPGHIPGAVNVDWVRNLTPTETRRFKAGAELARLYRRAGVTPDKEILVYCRTGVRASHTYFVLRLLGYPKVRLYDGSFVEWAADPGLPVAR
ncbi:MAG: sulfurtransferase [Candidatus Tectomicrobia bacterium]|uniref:Sulfurtransferase n=1 Tax=Tectimicrobiota bacterium TaxID=2528274 RepID=A0A932M202_UNCTE|nr:sulfurtransferase [Candidatus Tectomicrobia bacterium]